MLTKKIHVFLALAFVAVGSIFSGCSAKQKVGDSRTARVRFEFMHRAHNETFFAETDDPAVIAMVREELKQPLAQRSLHIHGTIARGSDGVNEPWHWHYVSGQWGMAQISMELCDGWPTYIESNLEKWLADVGSFCPWDSRVVREL